MRTCVKGNMDISHEHEPEEEIPRPCQRAEEHGHVTEEENNKEM